MLGVSTRPGSGLDCSSHGCRRLKPGARGGGKKAATWDPQGIQGISEKSAGPWAVLLWGRCQGPRGSPRGQLGVEAASSPTLNNRPPKRCR